MKLLIYFLSISSLYAQCGFLAGTVTDVSGSVPLVASVSAKTEHGKMRMGKSSEKGTFKAVIPCDGSALVIESKGYQPLTIPLHTEKETEATYFVGIKLVAIGKQTRDEPYAQSEQTHFVLKDSSSNPPKVIRRIVVRDALSNNVLPANLCLYYTQKQTRECYDLTASGPGIDVTFQEKDIVAMEVKSPGYQPYNGNLILDQPADSTRTYVLKLSKQHTILSVNIVNPHGGIECQLREAGAEPIIMKKVNDGHYYAEASAEKPYSFEMTDQNRNVELSTAIASLKEGITLRSIRIPVKAREARAAAETVRPEVNYTVENRTLYFPQSDYKLPSESKNYLDSLANWMLENKGKSLEINGYTDNVGNSSLNLTLSEYRVRVISQYLISKGVDQHSIRARGLGSKFPVAPNDTEKNRRKNRRVEVQIIDSQQKEN